MSDCIEKEDNSFLAFIEEQNFENQNIEVKYWTPLATLISESIELRAKHGLSQSDLSKQLKTTQSVISRFENMGRKPSYDFICRLSNALHQEPGMTLYGGFMGIVEPKYQKEIEKISNERGVSTKVLVQEILRNAVIEFIDNAPELQDKTIIDFSLSFQNKINQDYKSTAVKTTFNGKNSQELLVS